MKDLRVHNWTDLMTALYPGAPDIAGAFRSRFLFRGAGDVSFGLESSLARLGKHGIRIELPLLRSFRKYAEPGELTATNEWAIIAIAQHYGMPTRLLDWTTNPNVALHFATSELHRYDADAVVWCIDVVAAREILPSRLREALHLSSSLVFDPTSLATVVSSLPEFDALGDDFIVFFEPPPIDRRIIHQSSMFSITPLAGTSVEDLLNRHPELGRRVIVPSGLKWEIRDKLDLANVTERLLFPGLQGLGNWLTRLYTNRQGAPAARARARNRRSTQNVRSASPSGRRRKASRSR